MPKIPFWVFIIIAVVYFTSVRVNTMDIDASQYAEITRGMLDSHNYLQLYDKGADYLDKPPFLFWVSALSMKTFGVNNFGYKFPSIIFALWALFAIYKLTKRLYDEETGRLAALVFATCQGMFLMTNDIRCDTILLSWVITALWLLQEWVVSRKLWYLVGGSCAIAFGMMTKGPIALMVPVFCFSSDWILKREWKNFLSPYYFLSLVLIGLLLIPMSIGLYQQYDMHPEKGISGLRFFFWSQSFGRITGESPWKNDVNMGFLLQNMLWSFLPWIVVFIVALIANFVRLFKQKFRLQSPQEWITTGGFILAYLSLGSSGYQLPHYIFVAFPLASIITAVLIRDIVKGRYGKLGGFLFYFQTFLIILLMIAAITLVTYVFPSGIVVIAIAVVGSLCWIFFLFRQPRNWSFVWIPAGGMIFINFFITNFGYANLLNYQAGSSVGEFIHTHGIAPREVVIYKMEIPLHSIHFYAQGVIASDTAIDKTTKKYVLTLEDGLKEIKQRGYGYDTLFQGKSFKVSELTPEFINPKTRDKETRNYFLVKLK